jgi:hypothetical protein
MKKLINILEFRRLTEFELVRIQFRFNTIMLKLLYFFGTLEYSLDLCGQLKLKYKATQVSKELGEL